jgi:hypothetical protein
VEGEQEEGEGSQEQLHEQKAREIVGAVCDDVPEHIVTISISAKS